MRLYGVLGMMLIGCSGALYAQFAPPSGGCPPGMHLEGFACVYDSAPSAPSPSRPVWETRWGAIAVGRSGSITGFGASTNARSKRKAISVAMKQCKVTGGGDRCTPFTYHDQCAVVAWGDNFSAVQGAESIDIAAKLAMQYCNSRDVNCKIFYTGCSYPERVQ